MPQTTIHFRPATSADVNEAVPLIYSSGPDAFEYIFKDLKKGNAEQFLRFAFQKKGGELGYGNHVCATINGKVVGIGAIWSGKKSLRFMLSDIQKIIAFYGIFKCIAVLLRGLKLEMLIHPPKKKEFALGHLGIDASTRGKGIGTKLIEFLMTSVSIQSNEKIVLDVSFINPKAQKLYEKLGFKVTKTNHSNLERKQYNIKVPSHYRMELSNFS